MSGFAPLSWECVNAWSRQTGIVPAFREIEAMMLVDATLLVPPDDGGQKNG